MEFFSQLTAVVLVLGLAAMAAWLLRRGGMGILRAPGGGDKAIRVIERTVLAPQTSVQIVQVRDREFVLVLHGSAVTVLREAPAQVRGSDQ